MLGPVASCTYELQHTRLHLRPLQEWLASVYAPPSELGPHDTFPGPCLPQLVAGSTGGLHGHFLLTAPSGLGHISVRLGNLPMAPQDSRPEVSGRAIATHQHQRAQSSPPVKCLACQLFLPHISGRSGLVFMDNTAAMFYLARLWRFALSPCVRKQSSYGSSSPFNLP